jgi:hypothetical protein
VELLVSVTVTPPVGAAAVRWMAQLMLPAEVNVEVELVNELKAAVVAACTPAVRQSASIRKDASIALRMESEERSMEVKPGTGRTR